MQKGKRMEYQFITDLARANDAKVFFYISHKEFDYEKEISGEASFCKELRDFSVTKNALLFTRVTSNLFGVKNDSLIVYEKGVLFGVFDEMNCFDSKAINVLDTSIGRFCVLVESDILLDNIVQIVMSLDPDFVVVSVASYLMQEAKNLAFGVPTFVMGENLF